MSKIEKLVLDKYKEPIQNSDELVNAEKYFNGNYTKIENKVNEVIDNIDTRLNTLETDNTNNKQNILSIQQEQINQNNNIFQNKTDIELLEENLADEITTEEAENFTVKDAVRWYGKLDVSCNSVQESRSGKNKFDISKISCAITDRIIDKKTGTIQLNVSTDSTVNATVIYLCELKPNTNYKILYNYEGNKAGYGGTINNYVYNSETGKYEYLNNQKKITTNNSGKVQISLIGCQGAIPTTNYCKWSNIMLLEETEDETFEEFGAMPSPAIISEIQNCGDNVNIFDKNGTYNYGAGLVDKTSLQSDGTILTTSNFANNRSKQIKLDLQKNTDYVVSFEIKSIETQSASKGSYIEIVGYGGENFTQLEVLASMYTSTISKKQTFTFNSKKCLNYGIGLNGNFALNDAGKVIFENIKIEKRK